MFRVWKHIGFVLFNWFHLLVTDFGCVCPFVLFLLAIVLSVLRIWIIPLVSSNSS
jgi:hypothetical protein